MFPILDLSWEENTTRRCHCYIVENTSRWSKFFDLISKLFVVYYESRKRELQIRLMNEGRYDERLKPCLFIERFCLLLIDKARDTDKTYV